MNRKQPWTVEIMVVLLSALPVYWSGYLNGNPTLAFWVHIGIVAFYALIVRTFGHGSSFELGCLPVIIAVLFAILFPILKIAKAKYNRQRHAIVAPVAPQSKREQKSR